MSTKFRKRPQAYTIAIICLLLASVLSVLECVIDADVFRAVGIPQTAWADTGKSGAADDETAATEGKIETVRLNFFNSTWSNVLRKVAESTGSELVIQRSPAGRFTRYDAKRYSRTDAVRILNRELEPKGFRLLEQGKFLVVLHLDALRSRYQRPRLPASERGARNAELGVASSKPSVAGLPQPKTIFRPSGNKRASGAPVESKDSTRPESLRLQNEARRAANIDYKLPIRSPERPSFVSPSLLPTPRPVLRKESAETTAAAMGFRG